MSIPRFERSGYFFIHAAIRVLFDEGLKLAREEGLRSFPQEIKPFFNLPVQKAPISSLYPQDREETEAERENYPRFATLPQQDALALQIFLDNNPDFLGKLYLLFKLKGDSLRKESSAQVKENSKRQNKS